MPCRLKNLFLLAVLFLSPLKLRSEEQCFHDGDLGTPSQVVTALGKSVTKCRLNDTLYQGCEPGKIRCLSWIYKPGDCVDDNIHTDKVCAARSTIDEQIKGLTAKQIEGLGGQYGTQRRLACAHPDADSKEACAIFLDRLTKIETKLFGFKNYNEVKKLAAFQVASPETCRPDHNQGDLGTCHAFCLTCTWNSYEQKVLKIPHFQTSPNWLTLLSIAQRICTSAPIPKLTEGNSSPNVNRWAEAVGVCDENSFFPYSDKEPKRGRSISGLKELNPRPHVMELIRQLEGQSLKLPVFGTISPLITAEDLPYWEIVQQFGVTPQTIKDLFCPAGEKSAAENPLEYSLRLDRLHDSKFIPDEFYRCATEARTLRSARVNSKQPVCSVGSTLPVATMSPQERTDLIKAELAKGYPISVSMGWTSKDPKTGEDINNSHCVTVLGWDDKKGKFLVNNSWGEKKEETWPFNTGYNNNDIKFVYTTTCTPAGSETMQAQDGLLSAPAATGSKGSSR